MTNIGNKIKTFRDSLNMTIKELSLKSGVGKSTISEIETGKAKNPKMDTLARIANTLNVNINDLLSTEEKLNMTMGSMKKINSLAKEGLSSVMENSESYDCTTCNFFIEQFGNEKFSQEEREEITNYVKYVISKRK